MGRWATVLLALWLIAMGAAQCLHLSFDWMNVILGIMAIVAGVFLFMGK